MQYIDNLVQLTYNNGERSDIMAKSTTSNISIRMDSNLKAAAEALYEELGMNLSTAFNIFVRQSLRERGIPFKITEGTPSKETVSAMLEAERNTTMAKEKTPKTNAMRILDRLKISYEVLSYQCDEFIDGIHTADTLGIPHENCFKTLVLQGKSKGYSVFVLPIEEERSKKGSFSIFPCTAL